jgi:anti-anti-sigma factor
MPDLSYPALEADAAHGVPPQGSAPGGFGDSILWISLAEYWGTVAVSLQGDLDIVTLPSVSLALELAATRAAPVVLDCSRLRFLDLVALRFLCRARERARASGGDLTLTSPQGNVRRVLELTGSLPKPTPTPTRIECGVPATPVSLTPGRTDVLRAAVTAAGHLTGARMVSLQLADPAAKRLRMVAHQGFGRRFVEFFGIADDASSAGGTCASGTCASGTSASGTSASGTAARTGAPVWVPDVARSPLFSTAAAKVMLDAGAAAVAAVPVRGPGGKPIAVISVYREVPGPWPDVPRLQLERLAAVIGQLIRQPGGPASQGPAGQELGRRQDRPLFGYSSLGWSKTSVSTGTGSPGVITALTIGSAVRLGPAGRALRLAPGLCTR